MSWWWIKSTLLSFWLITNWSLPVHLIGQYLFGILRHEQSKSWLCDRIPDGRTATGIFAGLHWGRRRLEFGRAEIGDWTVLNCLRYLMLPRSYSKAPVLNHVIAIIDYNMRQVWEILCLNWLAWRNCKCSKCRVSMTLVAAEYTSVSLFL